MSKVENVLYVNNTGADLSRWHAEIAASLKSNGTLPEAFEDVFVAVFVCENLDGTPRYRIDAA